MTTTEASQTQQPRGALLVVEGGDRCGKTSQCTRLLDALHARGIDARAVKFPDRTSETGKLIDLYLKGAKDVDDHAVHLLFSANRWESMKHIRALLEQGTTLVVDRYAFSGVAYSAAKGLDLEWCKQPDRGLLRPDLVLFLDLDPIAAARRAGYGEERYERVDMQQRVRSNFMSLADGSWKILDASRTVDEIAADVSAAAIAAVEAARSTPLCSDLWCS